MDERPQEEEQRALCQLLVQYVATGPREKPAIEFVISRSIALGEALKHISEQEILDDCPDAPETEAAVRSLFSRLRRDVLKFFSDHPIGRKQKYKIVFDRGTYAPRFEVNDPPPRPGDHVQSFWSPYFASDQPVHLIYPELQVPGSRQSAPADFVPAGIVRAITVIFESLQRSPRVPVTATPIRAGIPFPEHDEDVIALGTSLAMPHLAALEASCPIRTGVNEVIVSPVGERPERYVDGDAGGAPLNNVRTVWAVLTRKPSRYRGRVMTVLAATDDTAIETLASFLTRQQELELLAEQIGMGNDFPNRFQVLFEVAMVSGQPAPRVEHILPRRVFKLHD